MNREVEEGIQAGSQDATRTLDWVTEIIRMMIRNEARLVDQFFRAPFLRVPFERSAFFQGVTGTEWGERVNNGTIIELTMKQHS